MLPGPAEDGRSPACLPCRGPAQAPLALGGAALRMGACGGGGCGQSARARPHPAPSPAEPALPTLSPVRRQLWPRELCQMVVASQVVGK